MKLSLRKAMFAAAALLLGSAAWAQEAHLDLDWTTATPWGTSQGRFGTGVVGQNAMFVANNSDATIVKFTEEGYETYLTELGVTPFGISADEAGNLVWNVGGGSALGATTYYVLPAGKQSMDDVVTIELTLPDGVEAARVDQIGRVLGNLLSEEGGWLVEAMPGNVVVSFKIANGQQVEAYASVATPAAMSSFSIAQPYFTTVEDCEGCDDPSMAAYVRTANSSALFLPNEDFNEWAQFGLAPYKASYGFDWFELDGERYYVYGAAANENTGNWTPTFVVAKADGTIVAQYDSPKEPAALNYGQFTCIANADGTVTIWRWCSAIGAQKFTFYYGERPVPPVEYNMELRWETATPWTSLSQGRFATAIGNAMYVANNTEASIEKFTKNGHETYLSGLGVTPFGITCDQAGNLIWNPGGGANAGATTYYVLPAGKQSMDDVVTIELTLPDGVEAARVDQLGRVVGNVLSEEGGWIIEAINGAKVFVSFKIVNGEQEECYASVNLPDDAALSTFSIAQPFFDTIEEIEECDDPSMALTGRTANASLIYYPSEDYSEFATLPVMMNYPFQSSYGFDTFVLNGTRFYVYGGPGGENAAKFTPGFIVMDENKNIVAQYESPTEPAAQVFGSIVCVPNEDGTVTIWRWTSKNGAQKFLFGIGQLPEEPEEPQGPDVMVYARGAEPLSWNQSTALTWNESDMTFSLDIPAGMYEFKLSLTEGAEGQWDEFNETALGLYFSDEVIDCNTDYSIEFGNTNNIKVNSTVPATVVVDLDAMLLRVNGETAPFVMPAIYLRGSFNEWGTTTEMVLQGEAGDKGAGTYVCQVPALEGEFKVASEDWATINLGAGDNATVENGVAIELFKNSQTNLVLPVALENVTVTLQYTAARGEEILLTVAGTVPAEPAKRAVFAYGISTDGTVVTYNLSGDAKAAYMHLDNGTDQVEIALDGLKAGENTVNVPEDLAAGEYSISIEVVSQVTGEEGSIVEVYADPDKQAQVVRGGVVIIRDTESPAFGLVGVVHGKGGGIDLYNQQGDYVNSYWKNWAQWNLGNQSSPFRGDARGSLMVFADWSDGLNGSSAAGEWVFDPMNPETEPYNMLPSEGKQTSGLASINGEPVGGGISGLAFQYSGEATVLYTFDEDFPGHNNTFARYDIGTAPTIVAAPNMWFGKSGNWANTNVEIKSVESNDQHQIFAAQVRSTDQCNGTVPGFGLYNGEGELLLTCGDIYDGENHLIENCNSAIAINYDGTLFAVSSYTELVVCSLEWAEDEYGDLIPEFTVIARQEITGADSWATMTFDRANNIHFYSRNGGGYRVYAIAGESSCTTPAPKAQKITTSAITISADEAGDAIFYNLQGQRVAADNLSTGVYIRVQGQQATKVVVK